MRSQKRNGGTLNHLSVAELFTSAEMTLPRERTNDDFVQYLHDAFSAYESAIDRVRAAPGLAHEIRSRKTEIVRLSNRIVRAVQEYLGGKPSQAYSELESGVNFVAKQVTTLKSLPVGQGTIAPLYRITTSGPGSVAKGRIFHPPFEMRHKVGRHRYGIAGFPCLYLGDSLELCVSELRTPPNQLRRRAVAEFAVKSGAQVNLLDFA